MGPTIIFDKSTFQSLSEDESVWLDALYLCNITPLFFVETLADLSLDANSLSRAPEDIVRTLARNTPSMSHAVNAHHRMMALSNLMGERFVMDGRPTVPGMVPARSGSGQRGMIMAVPPEQRAFQRWTRGAFREVERDYARRWRSQLTDIDLRAIYARYRPLVLAAQRRPQDLNAVKLLAEQIRLDPRSLGVPDSLWLALSLIGVPLDYIDPISRRWKDRGRPPIEMFAPYAAHVVLVDLVFNLAIAAELVGRERRSNRIDAGYLYYLPFAHVFTSRDRLQMRLAPLFLRPDQTFVHGDELKADLRQLDEYYSSLPDSEKERGVLLFGNGKPPESRDCVTTRMWDQHLPGWREIRRSHQRERTPERDREILDDLNSIAPTGRAGPDRRRVQDDPDMAFLKVEREIPVTKGKWLLVSRDVAARQRAQQ